MRRRDSCFCLIDSARLEFDKLIEFMYQTWTHRKWGRAAERSSPFRV